jgi:peroxiredoxin
MSMLALSLTLLSAFSAPAWQAGSLATWEGEMVADRPDDNVGAKTMALTVLVASSDADSTTYLWTLSDKGRGGFPWTRRFDQWRVSRDGRTLRGAGPAVLFDHGEGMGEAAISLLFAQPAGELQEGAAWTQGRMEFSVAEAATLDDRETWRIEVRGPTGQKGELWLDREHGLPVAVRERLTVGQGKPYTVRLKLKNLETASPERQVKMAAAFEAWISLRDQLKLEPDAREAAWTQEQLAALTETLPPAVAAAAETPLAEVAAAAEEDLRLQTGRSGRVAALRTRLLDRPAPNLELQGMRGETVASADLRGAVTVLHFWEYRDTPLEEPYGQVGYLDFLYRKRKDAGLKVYGVAVDDRLSNPATRGQAVSSARKLHSFMNLSYPMLLDDGTMLKRLGDPRAAGGKLPLFVMIGADGKVLHYHAGFHEVDRDLGLKDLDQAAARALNGK